MAARKNDEPWLHSASGFWCKKIEGKVHYLDRDLKTAKRKLGEIRRRAARTAAGEAWLDGTFRDLCNEFLADVKARKTQATYTSYRYRLLRALKHLPPELGVGEFSRYHMSLIEREVTRSVSPTTVRDTLATVQTVFNWATQRDLIERNPVSAYPKPSARQRTRVMTSQEFQAVLRALEQNPPFRRVLLALRYTGCRPIEIRELTWQMVDLDRGLWIIPEHKTITTQRRPTPRVIPLPPPIWKLCTWLSMRRTTNCEHVFLNTHGRPYSKDRFVKSWDRVRQRAKLTTKGGERVVLYTNRHTFATERVGKISDLELSFLLGHRSIETTSRYTHLNAEQLHEILRRTRS